MKEVKTDFIEQVIEIMKNNELTEVELEDKNSSLFIKAGSFKPVIERKEKEKSDEITIEKIEEKELVNQKKLVPIVSSMIGVLFLKPSPGEKPFVQVGDRIEKGQQVCIIETIKLMNKIVSETSGTVKEICIENAKPIEYGQTIMYIEQE